jgi:hypothetical protein
LIDRIKNKPNKGVFKKSGIQLTDEEQENELSMLNPYERKPAPKRNMVIPFVKKKSSKDSYLNNIVTDQLEIEDDEEEEGSSVRGYSCSHSTKNMILPHWCFVFSDTELREYVCVQINLPSGICHKVHGVQDRVEATVSTCKNKLIVACEWPETMCSSRCMQDALSGMCNNSTGNSSSYGSTMSNMIQAFRQEIHKIRVQNKISKNCTLGSTCTVDLPFTVETDMVICAPNWDKTIGSVNLYVVLKKMKKQQDMYKDNRMSVRVTKALGEEQKTEYSRSYINGMMDYVPSTPAGATLLCPSSDSDDSNVVMPITKRRKY